MKKLMTLLLSVSMIATLLVGCGGAKTEEAPATETTETVATEETATEEGLKIAIVSSPSGVDDGSFNQNNYEGIQAFIAANPGSKVTPVKSTNSFTSFKRTFRTALTPPAL